jgi:hypothetical protein
MKTARDKPSDVCLQEGEQLGAAPGGAGGAEDQQKEHEAKGGEAKAGEEECEEEYDTDDFGEDGEGSSQPNSPTASEAALLGGFGFKAHQGGGGADDGGGMDGVVSFQPEIALAFAGIGGEDGSSGGGVHAAAAAAAAAAAGKPPRQRRAGRVGKRKGGMPALCPGCGQAPLSEEDKRAASKRGRRKKGDDSGECWWSGVGRVDG